MSTFAGPVQVASNFLSRGDEPVPDEGGTRFFGSERAPESAEDFGARHEAWESMGAYRDRKWGGKGTASGVGKEMGKMAIGQVWSGELALKLDKEYVQKERPVGVEAHWRLLRTFSRHHLLVADVCKLRSPASRHRCRRMQD